MLSLLQYLCLPLKERVLSFIEDETWMLSKKHARVVMYIQHTIPKIHRRLYRFLVRIRQKRRYETLHTYDTFVSTDDQTMSTDTIHDQYSDMCVYL